MRRNPGIVKLKDATFCPTKNDQGYLILLEYMDECMTHFCEKCYKFMSENVIKYILWQVLTIVSSLHDDNIIHRDLKSDKVLFNHDG
jgi:serine/threonine protein kinase